MPMSKQIGILNSSEPFESLCGILTGCITINFYFGIEPKQFAVKTAVSPILIAAHRFFENLFHIIWICFPAKVTGGSFPARLSFTPETCKEVFSLWAFSFSFWRNFFFFSLHFYLPYKKNQKIFFSHARMRAVDVVDIYFTLRQTYGVLSQTSGSLNDYSGMFPECFRKFGILFPK